MDLTMKIIKKEVDLSFIKEEVSAIIRPSCTCLYCNKKFKVKSSWKRHLKNVHKRNSAGEPIVDLIEPNKFICAFCNKSYVEKRNLEQHIHVIHLHSNIKRSMKKFTCTSCNYETAYKTTLRRHIKSKHTEIPQNHLSKKYQCPQCPSKFSVNQNLNRHLRKVHGVGGLGFLIQRKCPLCPYTSIQRSKIDIHEHFEKVHNISIRKEQYRFNSIEEFNVWKSDLEKTTTSSYLKRFSNETVAYYQCHRCGYHKPKGHDKRRMKKSGSCKINGYCPANLNIKIKNNEVFVHHVSSHVGHKNELKHIHLSAEERKSIALQLANKKPHEEILKTIRGSISTLDLQKNGDNEDEEMAIDVDFNKSDEEEQNILKKVNQAVDPDSSLQNIKAKCTEEIGRILDNVHNLNQGKYFLQELKRVFTTIDAMNRLYTSILEVNSTPSPANTNIELQRKFTTTRKQRKANPTQKKLTSKIRNEIQLIF